MSHHSPVSTVMAGLLAFFAALPASDAHADSVRRARAARPAGTGAAPVTPAYRAAEAAYKAYEMGDYTTAARLGGEATRLAPGTRAYWLMLVNSLIAAGRLAEAELAIAQGIQRAGDEGSLAAQREPVRRGQAHSAGTAMYRALQAGDRPAATSFARAAVRYAPEQPGYRLALVSLLLQGGEFAEAEKIAGETLALLPDSTAPLMLRAHARQRMGRWTEARADHDSVLQQPRLAASVQRNVRLIAADAALAAGEPRRALDLLLALAVDDAEATSKRLIAHRMIARPGGSIAAPINLWFPPPGIDCSNVESIQTCTLLPGQPPQDPAYAVASEGYKALQANDFALAVDKARQATATSPGNRDYQLLLMNALIGAGRLQEAEQSAGAALALDADDAALLAQRGRMRRQLGDSAGAAQDFEAGLRMGSLPPATEIGLLADLGRTAEARLRLARAEAGGEVMAISDADRAYIAVRVGDDAAALRAFARADMEGKLPVTSLQDSAYTALRAGQDAEAITYFKRTVDAHDALQLKLEPQLLFDTRRAAAEVSRRWGVLASLTYRNGAGVVSGFGATPATSGTKTLQAGAEAYWRPFGYRNGRYVEIFARVFDTLHSQSGGPTGSESLQGALGIRWKPLSDHNAVVSLSRVVSRGTADDWLAQAAYSFDEGTDLRVEVPNWWTTRISAEVGRYFRNPQTFALASVQAGRSYRLRTDEGKTVVFPHAVATAEYNSSFVENLSVAAGPGVSLRHWFREDRYVAPRSYVDFTLQYRVRLAGDSRAKGLYLSSLISY